MPNILIWLAAGVMLAPVPAFAVVCVLGVRRGRADPWYSAYWQGLGLIGVLTGWAVWAATRS